MLDREETTLTDRQGRRIRLLGVRVSTLVKAGTQPPSTPGYSAPEENPHAQTELLFPDD